MQSRTIAIIFIIIIITITTIWEPKIASGDIVCNETLYSM